jgi:hypothetical protein
METPKGHAFAHFLVDYGVEFDLVWVCFQQSGEIWSWANSYVRAAQNVTLGRSSDESKKDMPSM